MGKQKCNPPRPGTVVMVSVSADAAAEYNAHLRKSAARSTWFQLARAGREEWHGVEYRIGNEMKAGEWIPAIVTRVSRADSGGVVINARGLADGTAELWLVGLRQGLQPGSWSWKQPGAGARSPLPAHVVTEPERLLASARRIAQGGF
jgi:hypothetical protein